MKKSPIKKARKIKSSRTQIRKPTRKNRTATILTILVLGLIVFFAVSKLPMFKPTQVAINEVAVAQATVTLSLPSSISAISGSEVSADITIDTGSSIISAAQVELVYDPTKLSTPTLIQGDFLPEKLGNPKIKDGLISFTYVIPLGSEGKTGTGKLATLKFSAKNGDSQLTFTKNTMVAAVGMRSNVLKGATGSNILMSGSTSSQNIESAPVLTDIQPAPARANPTQPPTTQNRQSTATPTSYLPENDYDYSQTSPNDLLGDGSPTTSIFARFLAAIKAMLGN